MDQFLIGALEPNQKEPLISGAFLAYQSPESSVDLTDVSTLACCTFARRGSRLLLANFCNNPAKYQALQWKGAPER